MPQPAVNLGFGSFAPAVAFFRRKLNVPTERWNDLWRGHHAHGFMVAGAAQTALLDDFRVAVDAAIADGESLAQFRARFDDTVARNGWDYNGTPGWRSRVIYETNLRTAWAAGRWQQLNDPDLAILKPYLKYNHLDGQANPRVEHEAWDGLVLRRDDPWWDSHYTPNGWGCKCWVTAVGKRDLERMGKSGPDKAPDGGTYSWTDRKTGEAFDVPVGIDPGWDYNVGKAQGSLAAAQSLGARILQMPADFRAAALSDTRRRFGDWSLDTEPFIDAIDAALRVAEDGGDAMRLSARALAVGFLPEAGVAALLRREQQLTTALIVMTDGDAAHMLRTDKRRRDQAIDLELLRNLPGVLSQYEALFYDTQDPALIFCTNANGKVTKVVVKVEIRTKASGVKTMRTARVTTAATVNAFNMRERRFVLLDGKL